jgi:hypothetical protein
MIARWWVFILLVAGPALAAPAPDKAAPVENAQPLELTETFLEAVGKGDVDKALDALPKGAGWALQQQKPDVLRGQIKTGIGLFGAYLGIERVREEHYTPSIARLVYLMKFEQHYLVWNVVYYKPKDRWEMSYLGFLDNQNALN